MKKFLAVLTILAVSLIGVNAFAAQIKVDDDTFANFGTKARLRITFNNPSQDDYDFTIPEARIYFSGQITNLVKFGFNYDFATSGAAANGGRATDAFINLAFNKSFNLQTGFYRMAVSRIALQDSYQYILITGPDVAPGNLTSSGLAGYRGAGISAWGDIVPQVRYYVGLWDGDFGSPNAIVAANSSNNTKGYSARVVLNFMDPEKGYACPGCYLGKAKVANIGVGYLSQDYTVGATENTYSQIAVDAFYDADGVTAEFGYFMYDWDTNYEPSAWYLQAAYVMDKIQPAIRYESWDDDGGTDWDQIVAGVNYLFDGQAAKVGIEYKKYMEDGAATDPETWSIQMQVQF